jgi:hypothetical protein
MHACTASFCRPRPPPPPLPPLPLFLPLLCRLGDRFGEHAQFGKQRALQLLREQLAGLKIDSTQVWWMFG